MATQIQEPADLPAGSITDANASHFRVLVYQQDQEFAGIKTLGIGDWKTFLSYNGIAVDNVATFIGIDTTEYNYKAQTLQPLPAGMDSVVARITNLAANCGVSTQSGAMTSSLQEQINTLDGYVVDGWGEGASHKDGLLDRVQSNENDISDLQEAIGGGGGGGSGAGLTNRVQTLENNTGVGEGTSYSGNPLVTRIDTLENTVGKHSESPTPATGLCLDVETLQNTVGDSTSGLVKDVETLKTEVESSVLGLLDRTSSLETTVGNSNNGLVKDVSDLQTLTDTLNTNTGAGTSYSGTPLATRIDTLETKTGVDDNYSGQVLTTRLDNIEQKISGVYTYKGNIEYADNTGSATVSLTIDGQVVQFDTFNASKNGYVFNILPTTGDDVKIFNRQPDGTLAKQSFGKGTNIVWNWVDNGTDPAYGYFDELGTVIDVSKIDELDIKVSGLESKFITDTDTTSVWSSTSILKTGVYLITGYSTLGGTSRMDSFIAYISSGNYSAVNKINDTNNLFDFNTSTYVISAVNANVDVRITQIG